LSSCEPPLLNINLLTVDAKLNLRRDVFVDGPETYDDARQNPFAEPHPAVPKGPKRCGRAQAGAQGPPAVCRGGSKANERRAQRPATRGHGQKVGEHHQGSGDHRGGGDSKYRGTPGYELIREPAGAENGQRSDRMGELSSEVDEVRRECEWQEQNGGGDRSMSTGHRSGDACDHSDERHCRRQSGATQTEDGQQWTADHRIAVPVPVVVVLAFKPVAVEVLIDLANRGLATAQCGTLDRRLDRIVAHGIAKADGAADALRELVDLVAVRRLAVLLGGSTCRREGLRPGGQRSACSAPGPLQRPEAGRMPEGQPSESRPGGEVRPTWWRLIDLRCRGPVMATPRWSRVRRGSSAEFDIGGMRRPGHCGR
jgi:hypothetical protein